MKGDVINRGAASHPGSTSDRAKDPFTDRAQTSSIYDHCCLVNPEAENQRLVRQLRMS